MYSYWLDPPVPIFMQFYMFNITNPKEFLEGQRPAVAQSGPYTYRYVKIPDGVADTCIRQNLWTCHFL